MEFTTYKHLPIGPGGFKCRCCQPFRATHAEAKALAARWIRRANRKKLARLVAEAVVDMVQE